MGKSGKTDFSRAVVQKPTKPATMKAQQGVTF